MSYPYAASDEDWENVGKALTYICENEGVAVSAESCFEMLRLHAYLIMDKPARELFVKQQRLPRAQQEQAEFTSHHGVADTVLAAEIAALEAELNG